MLKIGDLSIEWLGHASFKLVGERILYIDPYDIESKEKADIILITHAHFDHCSIADIQKISTPNTIVIGPPSCQSKVSSQKVGMKDYKIVRPGVKMIVEGINIEAVPSYNLNKKFHPKIDENVGYIIGINGKRIYHAGDTDKIPEMAGFKNIDVAMLPIGGTYTMDAKEASDAASMIMPKLVIPMHYGKVIGTSENAETFKKLCRIPVEIKC